MAETWRLRDAADERVGEYADYDEDFEYCYALVSDETFGTIAHCLREFRLMDLGAQDLDTEARDCIHAARDELETALDRRANIIKERQDDD